MSLESRSTYLFPCRWLRLQVAVLRQFRDHGRFFSSSVPISHNWLALNHRRKEPKCTMPACAFPMPLFPKCSITFLSLAYNLDPCISQIQISPPHQRRRKSHWILLFWISKPSSHWDFSVPDSQVNSYQGSTKVSRLHPVLLLRCLSCVLEHGSLDIH